MCIHVGLFSIVVGMDKQLILSHMDRGFSQRETANALSVSRSALLYWIKKYDIKWMNQREKYSADVLSQWLRGTHNGTRGKKTKVLVRVVRQWVLDRDNHRCSICGIGEWMKNPLTLEVDHIDGNHKNNRPENLRALCPNCHSQTETYKAKNSGNGRPYFRENHR